LLFLPHFFFLLEEAEAGSGEAMVWRSASAFWSGL
jgi:hypothetical protein